MILDLANMLQTSIQRRNQFNYEHQVAVRPEEGLRIDYVALNVSLARLANVMGWYKLGEDVDPSDSETLLTSYVDLINRVFHVAARQTWSHLIVIKPDDLEALKEKQKAKSLSQEFLSIQHFIDQSLFERQQDAFRHAWHLILKLGLVDLGFDEETIQKTFLN
ncbi:dUTP diphosphatase [Secundilactobacillus folii]|uniref:dUTPase n=1 Tax=Secundilactobacillus folii TaxID=2678357 RepID=A0A7X3C0U5_9LACO|nr:dUTP diphosphatase [Secundilactobacillus folii]MTV81060.1 hypothetical protein [Secundilactobacillus folii]